MGRFLRNRRVPPVSRGKGLALAAGALLASLSGCIVPSEQCQLLGFTPDGKTLLYCRDSRVMFGIPLGMHFWACGPQRIDLYWRRVDAPEQTERLKLWTGCAARGLVTSEKSLPRWSWCSPDSRHAVIQLEERFLLVDLEERTHKRIGERLGGLRRVEWISSHELLLDGAAERTSGDDPADLSLYRWDIRRPHTELELVYARRARCWKWYLSPDKSRVVVGPCCPWGQCRLVELKTRRAHPLGPPGVRLARVTWTADSSLLFCELKVRPGDPKADRDSGPRRYLLVPRAEPDSPLADHTEPRDPKLGGFLGFAPDSRELITSDGRLVKLTPWEVTDFGARIIERQNWPKDVKMHLQRLPVPGWLVLWRDTGAYAVDASGDRLVPIRAEPPWVVSRDGKWIAELLKPSMSQVMIRRLDLPPGGKGVMSAPWNSSPSRRKRK